MFRLDALERYALAQMFQKIPKNCDAWLFGSRTNPDARGGDIDIFIQTDLTAAENFALSVALSLEFKKHCDEKIDVVVYPKINLNQEQAAFLASIKKLPLGPVVAAPRLDHVACLTTNLKSGKEHFRDTGYQFQREEEFDGEGTRECYIGEPKRKARVLLLQAIKEGPYQRTLQKRGPGLHHIGVLVTSLSEFLNTLSGSGWSVHPATPSPHNNLGLVYLFAKGVPLIVEVHEKPHDMPANLAPVVQKVRVKIEAPILSSMSTLNIPELEWSTAEETALQILGHWRPIKSFC